MAKIMSQKSFVEKTIPMNAQSPLDLTEGQKACLRLVVQQQTSKEIARVLGISPFTVDQRLDAARRKLNAASRKTLLSYSQRWTKARYTNRSYTKRQCLKPPTVPLAKTVFPTDGDGNWRK